MARFTVEGDEDGNEKGSSNNRRLPKRPRTSDPIAYAPKRASASASNTGGHAAPSKAGNTASTSAALQSPLARESRPEKRDIPVLYDDNDLSSLFGTDKGDCTDFDMSRIFLPEASENESEEEAEEDANEEEEELEQQTVQSGDGVQPTETRVNSTLHGNGTGPGSVEHGGDAPAPLSVTLTDPDVLDCAICFEPLSPPVYQCENGHIACASCCFSMKNKCASCCWPIGYNRCRAIEKVLESIRISCRYMQHGCKALLNYSKKLDHEKTCIYATCSCPHPDCTYIGLPPDLYSHFFSHSNSSKRFLYEYPLSISLDNNQKHAFLQEKLEYTVFVLNRFIEPRGSLVNVVCIAPTSSKVKFLYEVGATDGVSSIKLKTVAEMTPIWTQQPSDNKYVLVPNDFITSGGQLKLELTIRREA